MIDVPRVQVTFDNNYPIIVHAKGIHIPDCADANFITYALGWTWVKDHAD
jgi:hypothetical protein